MFVFKFPPQEPGSVLSEHSYSATSSTSKCLTCNVKGALIKNYVTKVKNLDQKVKKLKHAVRQLQTRNEKNKPFSVKHIKTDAKMNFYTGITSIKINI